jgi:lantibiotic modifying enzyme
MALQIGQRLLEDEKNAPIVGCGLGGASGMALAFDALAQATADPAYFQWAHAALRRAAIVDDPSIGLFSGLSGVRAAAALFSKRDPRYGKLVEQCDSFIESRLPKTNRRNGEWGFYDVISGWSGARLARGVKEGGSRDRLVDLLVWLMADDSRWRCVHPRKPGRPRENDQSMAHGIAGVLATLALTISEADDESHALLRVQADALVNSSVAFGDRVTWSADRRHPPRGPSTPSWCYGTPGIASALYSTSRLLNDSSLEAFALAALEGDASLDPADWGLTDHALCHGTLGAAMVFASAGLLSGRAKLLRAVANVVTYALETLERDGGACWTLAPDLASKHDAAGELDGASGVLLALLTLAGDAESSWLLYHGVKPFTLTRNEAKPTR